jgi:hypothetical protein
MAQVLPAQCEDPSTTNERGHGDQHTEVSPAIVLHFLLLFARIPFFYMLRVEEKIMPRQPISTL